MAFVEKWLDAPPPRPKLPKAQPEWFIGEPLPEARLAKLPSLTSNVAMIGFCIVGLPIELAAMIINLMHGTWIGASAMACWLLILTYSMAINYRGYKAKKIRREELRESNFWAAMDFVIETEPPELSKPLLALEVEQELCLELQACINQGMTRHETWMHLHPIAHKDCTSPRYKIATAWFSAWDGQHKRSDVRVMPPPPCNFLKSL